MGIALAFVRDQSPLIQAGMLGELIDLYRQERADSDAVAQGFKNRVHEALEKWRKAREKAA